MADFVSASAYAYAGETMGLAANAVFGIKIVDHDLAVLQEAIRTFTEDVLIAATVHQGEDASSFPFDRLRSAMRNTDIDDIDLGDVDLDDTSQKFIPKYQLERFRTTYKCPGDLYVVKSNLVETEEHDDVQPGDIIFGIGVGALREQHQLVTELVNSHPTADLYRWITQY